MSRPKYIDPAHLAEAPDMLRNAIATGDTEPFFTIAGFREFAYLADKNPVTADLIEAFYAYVLSDNFACLKCSFLVTMIRAARTADPDLGERLLYTTIPAIICLLDVWTRANQGSNPVEGYEMSSILPTVQIAGEFAVSFNEAIRESGNSGHFFDEAIEDNAKYVREHDMESESIELVHSGKSTFAMWRERMGYLLDDISPEDAQRAYDALVSRCETDYRSLLQESLRRKIALRKCSVLLHNIDESIDRLIGAASAASAASARTSRPCTTPARVQTAHASPIRDLRATIRIRRSPGMFL